jgi:hypothetical protein
MLTMLIMLIMLCCSDIAALSQDLAENTTNGPCPTANALLVLCLCSSPAGPRLRAALLAVRVLLLNPSWLLLIDRLSTLPPTDQETISVIQKDLAALEARVDASLHGEIYEMEAAIQEGIRIAREMHSPRGPDHPAAGQGY